MFRVDAALEAPQQGSGSFLERPIPQFPCLPAAVGAFGNGPHQKSNWSESISRLGARDLGRYSSKLFQLLQSLLSTLRLVVASQGLQLIL